MAEYFRITGIVLTHDIEEQYWSQENALKRMREMAAAANVFAKLANPNMIGDRFTVTPQGKDWVINDGCKSDNPCAVLHPINLPMLDEMKP